MPESRKRAFDPQPITVEECKAILGESIAEESDEQIAKMLDDLEQLAGVMYDELETQARNDLERVIWTAYANEHPEDAC
jgi:gamma-glutamylcyclotransferase (GGCT)/AIG2-like uncharacterized protein YtfP